MNEGEKALFTETACLISGLVQELGDNKCACSEPVTSIGEIKSISRYLRNTAKDLDDMVAAHYKAEMARLTPDLPFMEDIE